MGSEMCIRDRFCHTGEDVHGFHYDPLVFDRSTRRRTGPLRQNRDSRPLRRQYAVGGREREDVILPASRGDITEEALSLDLVRVVLSDGEEGQEVNAPARARRLLRRASSEIALGHADTVLAARVERAAVGSATVPRVQGAGAAAAGLEDSAGSSAAQPIPASMSAGVATAPDPVSGGDAVVDGPRRSARIRDKGETSGRTYGKGLRR